MRKAGSDMLRYEFKRAQPCSLARAICFDYGELAANSLRFVRNFFPFQNVYRYATGKQSESLKGKRCPGLGGVRGTVPNW